MTEVSAFTIEHEDEEGADRGRYVVRLEGGHLAVLEYSRLDGGVVSADRTFTPLPARGQGVAAALVARLVEDARRQSLTIRPTCPYVADWFERHPEAKDVLAA